MKTEFWKEVALMLASLGALSCIMAAFISVTALGIENQERRNALHFLGNIAMIAGLTQTTAGAAITMRIWLTERNSPRLEEPK